MLKGGLTMRTLDGAIWIFQWDKLPDMRIRKADCEFWGDEATLVVDDYEESEGVRYYTTYSFLHCSEVRFESIAKQGEDTQALFLRSVVVDEVIRHYERHHVFIFDLDKVYLYIVCGEFHVNAISDDGRFFYDRVE